MLQHLLPLLMPSALTLAGAALMSLAALRSRRRPYPCCVRCEYNLSWLLGAVTECPECGTSLRGGRVRQAHQRAHGWEWAQTAGVVTLCLGGLILSIAAGVQFS